jgi:hypothetical protein
MIKSAIQKDMERELKRRLEVSNRDDSGITINVKTFSCIFNISADVFMVFLRIYFR